MSENVSSQGQPQPADMQAAARSTLVKTGLAIAIFGLALFLAAGRLDWPLAWVYLGLVFISTLIVTRLMSTELLAERGQIREDARRWDIPLALIIARIGPLAMMVIAGLDRRFSWSAGFPVWLPWVGVAALVAGLAFSDWAMVVNRFFSGIVRIQTERGHTVVSSGPYGWVRHPGYAGSVLCNLATPLILASWWSLIPAAVVVAVTVLRTALEDRTLQAELDGYAAYARRVRYRLVPGIW